MAESSRRCLGPQQRHGLAPGGARHPGQVGVTSTVLPDTSHRRGQNQLPAEEGRVLCPRASHGQWPSRKDTPARSPSVSYHEVPAMKSWASPKKELAPTVGPGAALLGRAL